MRALTIRQPWATLIAIGAKSIETRSRRISYRGLIAIHAAKSFLWDARVLCNREPFRSALAEVPHGGTVGIPLGAIVALAQLAGCFEIPAAWAPMSPANRERWVRERWVTQQVDGILQYWPYVHVRLGEHEHEFGDFMAGRYGWVLSDVRQLREPVPCRGHLGLWTVPDELDADVRSRVGSRWLMT